MPDTLAADWTWDMLPEWEHDVLQSLVAILSSFGFRTYLREPSASIMLGQLEVDHWCGINVWSKLRWWYPKTWFNRVHLGDIYCSGNVLDLRSRGGQWVRLDLFDPTSIDRTIRIVRNWL